MVRPRWARSSRPRAAQGSSASVNRGGSNGRAMVGRLASGACEQGAVKWGDRGGRSKEYRPSDVVEQGENEFELIWCVRF